MRISKNLGERFLKAYSKIRSVGYRVCGRCNTQFLFVPGDYWDMYDMDSLLEMRKHIRELDSAAETLERLIKQDAKKPLTDADNVVLYSRDPNGLRKFVPALYGSGLCIREATVFKGVSQAIAYRDSLRNPEDYKMGRHTEVHWRGMK